MATKSLRRLLTPMLRLTQLLAFIAAYVALDWASYLHPLHGLNITLWNPAPALGLVLWMRFGRMTAIPWFLAIMLGELAIRGMPAAFFVTAILSAVLTVGYGAIGELLRQRLPDGEVFGDRIRLTTWLSIVGIGTLANSLLYISLLSLTELLPEGDRIEGFIRFWVGDCVGIVVSMPMLWMVLTNSGQARLRTILASWETGGYAALAVVMLWVTFGNGASAEFQYFYFLFLPVIWAAARQGLTGAATSAFILQAGIIFAVEWLNLVAVTVLEFQMLGAVLALVGFFIGVVVDEQRLAVDKLKQTLHLAVAGEMAAALAHELNQPMTALAAYGNACEYLLARGETGEALRDAIRRMVAESTRAAEVVRRVRDFFRTGATRLETIDIATLLSTAAGRFAERASNDGVQLQVEGAPIIVRVDRLQIELVLRNLLANAFDAVASQPEGKRRINVSVEPFSRGTITIIVSDSGPGLAASLVGSLFEPFASTKSSGLGLGLVISRALVEAHGGRLWAEPGDSGIFRFSLPANEKESE
ncbi:MAG: ATP-binding region, ATPase-like:Histidine kinase N-terminal [Proteobacteria bacterium]|nr:ATP-binding region, ATPase-like:Histidine kinase N-terminal [Pseudomonadota bacterium]